MESVDAVEVFSPNSARYRYRVPLSVLRELPYEGSHYSPEFEVGGWVWRFHLQERRAAGAAGEEERYLALHLQSCTVGSIQAHFKLVVVCVNNPLESKSKSFNCTFKKAGSAWGLHQFMPMDEVLHLDGGYVYHIAHTGTYCVDFEIVLHLKDGTSRGGAASKSPHGAHAVRSVSGSRVPVRGSRSISTRGVSPRALVHAPSASAIAAPLALTRSNSPGRRAASVISLGRGSAPRHYDPEALSHRAPFDGLPEEGTVCVNPAVRAPLVYPFEHLEGLCDMSFDVQGVRVKAHRCVVAARMKPLLPEQMMPLQVGCIVAIAVPLDVFSTFLRYIYTEECPEQGTLPPDSLLDLYLLSAACEFYDLSSVCLQYVRPLLTPENILPIVLTRYNAADEVLTALYLRILLESYEVLIQDKRFESIPGHLFRRLSLILCQQDVVPFAAIPPMKNSLGKQLTWLAETGEYSDMEWVVGPQRYTIRAHRFLLASRSIIFSQYVKQQRDATLPDFTGPEFDFSLRSWQKLLSGMYRRHLDDIHDLSAEDMAIIFKMHHVLGMDGQLRKEAEAALSPKNALRILIYALKHHVPELHERALAYVVSNFHDLIRDDPQAWDLMGELPKTAVLGLFRTVSEQQR